MMKPTTSERSYAANKLPTTVDLNTKTVTEMVNLLRTGVSG
jgi:hypothetical protein